MDYSMDYSGKSPEQKGASENASQYDPQQLVTYQPRRHHGVPSIVTTIVAVVVTFVLVCSLEGLGPIWARPSTWFGTFNARVEVEVKAAEIAQQAKFEAYVATVKLGVEQQNEQYKALSQSVLSSYQMQGQRATTLAGALGSMQAQYQASRIAQAQTTQGTDYSIINMARMIGRVANLLDQGSGDSALSYADNLNAELSKELNEAVSNGVTIKVEGWDTGIPSAEEIQRQLASLKPYSVPPPPRFDQETEAYRATHKVSQ